MQDSGPGHCSTCRSRAACKGSEKTHPGVHASTSLLSSMREMAYHAKTILELRHGSLAQDEGLLHDTEKNNSIHSRDQQSRFKSR